MAVDKTTRISRGAIVRISVSAVLALAFGGMWLSRAADTSEADRPDVIFILVDTLRADRLSCYGYPRATSPNIDRLAAEGIVFLNHKAQSSVTMTSMASLFKSRYTGDATLGNPSAPEDLVFAEVMRAAGYRTAGVQSNPWLTRPQQFARGFDDYHLLTPTKSAEGLAAANWTESATHNVFYADADAVADVCVDVLTARGGRPLFLYAHFMDPHGPYIPPTAHQRFSDSPLSTAEAAGLTGRWVQTARSADKAAAEAFRTDIAALYDAEISYVDAAIGRIIDTVKRQGRYSRTVFLIASDHGEGFLEHGEVLHANSLYEELLHTPLVLRAPGRRPQRYDGLTRNIDIAPTVFEIAGIDAAWGSRDGVSLLEAMRGEAQVVESAARTRAISAAGPLQFGSLQYGGLKYIVAETPWQSLTEHLYNLDSDPGETANLAASRAETLAAMAARLAARTAPGPAAEPILDAETRRRLMALGYLQ